MITKTANSLHEAMHRIPGVPPHREPQAREINGANRHHHHQHQHQQQQQQQHRLRLQNQTSHQDAPPSVLVAWQNKIGGVFRRKP